jgi:hypothetical protein
VLILQPLKVTTPNTSLGEQPESVPGPPEVGVPAAMARVTVLLSVVTTLPPASSTVTLGCVGKAVPPVELAGCWVNTSCAAGPTVMLKVLLSAVASEPSAACSL